MFDGMLKRILAKSEKAVVRKVDAAEVGAVTSPFFQEMADDFRRRALAELAKESNAGGIKQASRESSQSGQPKYGRSV